MLYELLKYYSNLKSNILGIYIEARDIFIPYHVQLVQVDIWLTCFELSPFNSIDQPKVTQ